jgi:hypothetical protein
MSFGSAVRASLGFQGILYSHLQKGLRFSFSALVKILSKIEKNHLSFATEACSKSNANTLKISVIVVFLNIN